MTKKKHTRTILDSIEGSISEFANHLVNGNLNTSFLIDTYEEVYRALTIDLISVTSSFKMYGFYDMTINIIYVLSSCKRAYL